MRAPPTRRPSYRVLENEMVTMFCGHSQVLWRQHICAEADGTDENIQADNNNSKICAILVNKCHSTMMAG